MDQTVRTALQPLMSDRGQVSRILCALLVLCWFMAGLFPSMLHFFALVPLNTMNAHYYIWNVFTAGLFETNTWLMLLNLGIVAVMGPILERTWGDAVFIKFLVIVNLCIGVGLMFFMIALFYATGSEYFILAQICGFSGISAAFAVVMKQRYGERVLWHVQTFDVCVKHIPMVLFATSIIFWYFGGPGKDAFNILFGTYFGWLYLRFFMQNPDTGAVGDMREEFALVTLLPVFLRPLLSPIASCMYSCYHFLGCLPSMSSQATLPTTVGTKSSSGSTSSSSTNSGSSSGGIGAGSFQTSSSLTGYSGLTVAPASTVSSQDRYVVPLVSISDPIAERRRALAIKAIDEKLASLARGSSTAQPAYASSSQPVPYMPLPTSTGSAAAASAIPAPSGTPSAVAVSGTAPATST